MVHLQPRVAEDETSVEVLAGGGGGQKWKHSSLVRDDCAHLMPTLLIPYRLEKKSLGWCLTFAFVTKFFLEAALRARESCAAHKHQLWSFHGEM